MKKEEILRKLVIHLKEERKQEKEYVRCFNDVSFPLHLRLEACSEAFQHSLTADSIEREIIRRVLVLYR